jgi:hypothetical protein
MTGVWVGEKSEEGKGKSGSLRDDNKKTSKCKGKGDGERNGDWSYLPV